MNQREKIVLYIQKFGSISRFGNYKTVSTNI